jgi:hypothetical protein
MVEAKKYPPEKKIKDTKGLRLHKYYTLEELEYIFALLGHKILYSRRWPNKAKIYSSFFQVFVKRIPCILNFPWLEMFHLKPLSILLWGGIVKTIFEPENEPKDL